MQENVMLAVLDLLNAPWIEFFQTISNSGCEQAAMRHCEIDRVLFFDEV